MGRRLLVVFVAAFVFGLLMVASVLAAPGAPGEPSPGVGRPPFLEEGADLPQGIEQQSELPPGLDKKSDEFIPPGQDGAFVPPGQAKGEDWLPPGIDEKADEWLPPGLDRLGKTPPGWVIAIV